MPSANGIRAGRAFVELLADDSRLARGQHRAEAKVKGFGTGQRVLGVRVAS